MKNEQWVFDEENGRVETDAKKVVAFIAGGKSTESVWRGELIAIAPDHALFGSAVARGILRWEAFQKGGQRGELCFGGFRYSTELDPFGVPRINDAMRTPLFAKMSELTAV